MINVIKDKFIENDSSRKKIKLKHVNACLFKESQYKKSAGFDSVDLSNESASQLSLSEISLTTSFLGHEFNAPLMIAPMTGGTRLSAILNKRWAMAANHFGIALGVGSQRLALRDKSVEESFQVRKFAKSSFIFANIGAAQIREKKDYDLALKAVDMIEANALFIHVNPLQESCQEHGDSNFKNILHAISDIVSLLDKSKIPVLVREVSFGISKEAAKRFMASGIAGIDCAGAGGTSWAKVEALCSSNERFRRLGEAFGEWGIPTAVSIKNVRTINKNFPLIATGGIRSGLDAAKAIALGADLSAMAQPMLVAAIKSEEALFEFIEQILLELRVAMFAAGAKTLKDLPQRLTQRARPIS